MKKTIMENIIILIKLWSKVCFSLTNLFKWFIDGTENKSKTMQSYKFRLAYNETSSYNIYLGIYSVTGATLTLYYCFNREQFKIRKEKDDEEGLIFIHWFVLIDKEAKTIVPKSIQERYLMRLDDVLNNVDEYDKLKKEIIKIKRKRLKKVY